MDNIVDYARVSSLIYTLLAFATLFACALFKSLSKSSSLSLSTSNIPTHALNPHTNSGNSIAASPLKSSSASL